MNLNFLHPRSSRLLLSIMLVFGIMLSEGINTFGVEFNPKGLYLVPTVPRFSLTGAQFDFNKDWYPDGIIRMVPSDNVMDMTQAREMGREFLMPVFIDNKWTKYPGPGEVDDGVSGREANLRYIPNDVHSFEFKIQYDSTVLRAIGIQKFHPFDDPEDPRFQNPMGEFYQPLAKDFHVEWHDYKDTSYRWMIYGDETNADKEAGRTIKITGSSATPLQRTSLGSDDFRILLYVKFRVVNTGGLANPKPIYIANDTIMINDLNIAMDPPFWKYRNLPGYQDWNTYYEDPNGSNNPRLYTATMGLAGVSNYDMNPVNQENWTIYAKTTQRLYRPGVIWIIFSQRSPELDFYTPDSFISQPISRDPDNEENFTLVEPVTVDWESTRDNPAYRDIFLRNTLDGSRIQDLEIESDSKWLEFRTIPGPTNHNWIPFPTRKDRIQMIDEGILGPFNANDPLDRDTEDDGDVQLRVLCDPNKLDAINDKQDAPGIYVGYLTFKSAYMRVSPVRLRVTFIYFKTPLEWNNRTRNPGIEVIVENSRGLDPENPDLPPGPDQKNLIFGTGPRATRSVDTLYGEFAQPSPMADFDARWYPPIAWGWTPTDRTTEADAFRLENYGYGDWAPNAWNPRSNSRDIRDTNDFTKSLIYYCKFNPGHASYYPIKVKWDVQDFPEGANFFLRDALNGAYFNVNMRDATLLGEGSKYSYVIQDPSINDFIIEYTPARIINFVDINGNPNIKKGWNFLSLHLRPVNSTWNVYFPNALNKPYWFSQNQWQDIENLKPGVGYFIKYSDDVDVRFAGSYIGILSEATGDPIKLYPGWNTIGALSVTTDVDHIEFTPYMDFPTPGRSYTKEYGVWGYQTSRGYEEVSNLVPGFGYWIKVGIAGDEVNSAKAHGFLKLTAPTARLSNVSLNNDKEDVLNSSAKIVVRDNAQHQGKVYVTDNMNYDMQYFELPPVPPSELFDMRFNDGKYVTRNESSVIRLQGVKYPLSISVENADANYTFVDPITNEVLGTINKGSSKNIEINYLSSNSVKVMKSESGNETLISCYPNPVAGNAKINYTVAEDGPVTIALYDIVGNKIRNIVSDDMKSGHYETALDATGLVGGTYIIKITTAAKTAIHTVTVVK